MGLLSGIVRWSLEHRPTVIMATLLVVLLGFRAARELPIDAVPDITNVQVQVITTAPALGPLEIEQYVSIPVERVMQGLPRADEVRSLSKYGISVITIVFEEGTDIYFARQLVGERMAQASSAIPDGYGSPELGPISTGMGEVLQFTVRNPELDLMELEELLTWYIAPQLESTPGVVEVNPFGGRKREYHVVLDPELLRGVGMSAADVAEALRLTNANAGGGYIERNGEHFVIGTDGLARSADDLRKTVLGTTPQGTPITIDAVGEVRFGSQLRRGAATMDAEGEVVVGVTLMLMGENSRTVTEAAKKRLAELEPTLPPGTVVEPFYDRTRLVDRTIRTAVTNLAEGALLVIVVLLLLIGNLRSGLIVAAVIPLSMLFALIAMEAFGVSGNLMSLGALDFGIIVDGAVIVVENAARRLGVRRSELGRALRRQERVEVVRDATLEVRRATVYGEAIIALVYVPILMLRGTEGKLFTPMATTVLFALAGAFVLSLTLVPVLSALLIQPRPEAKPTLLMRALSWGYRPLLDGVLRGRVLVVLVGAGIFAAASTLLPQLGAEFVPQLDEGDILIEGRRIPGVSLSQSIEHDLRIQEALMPIPEIEHVVCKTGSPELATDVMGIGDTDVFIQLADPEHWRPGLTKDDLVEEIHAAATTAVPEVASSISQPIEMRTNELVAGIRSDVGILIYGPDLDRLVSLGGDVASAVRNLPGVVDVRAEQISGLTYLEVIPDRDKLARYGLSIADVNLVAETIAVGHPAGTILEGDRKFGLRVMMKHAPAGDIDALARLPVRAPGGLLVPLGEVAELRFVKGPVAVDREGLARRIIVEFNIRGRDLVSTVEAAQRAVKDRVRLPVGYRMEWGGMFEDYQSARDRLEVIVPITVGLILFVLWSAFRAIRPSLVVLLNVPFAAVGGVVALYLRDIPFSISAGVGFIALFGVVILNDLVLVTFARRREAEGASPADAVRHACDQRLRPVLMTALTDVLGFIPMAISTAPGAEVQRPLATVVIGGVITATLLTLFLLPAVYSLVAKGRPRTSGAVDGTP